MIYAIISIISSFIIAFGRQVSVFGRLKAGLWFFSKFERKRLVFALVSLAFGIVALISTPITSTIIILLSLSVLFLLFSFYFDMKYFFPEINQVIRKKASDINIEDHTKVIGLTVSNIAVAYPLEKAVIPRHIIIDQIGGKQVLICYCALCRSALAFDTTVDGEELYFRVAGVWRRNMIIHDTKTYSLWQQATGECIYGKYKGKSLNLLSGENLSWGEWKKQHTETEFAVECKESRKGYLSIEKMNRMIHKASNNIIVPGFSNLEGLLPRETVFGVDFNGETKAFPQTELQKVDEPFEVEFDNQKIILNYNKEADYLYAIEKASGEKIMVEKHWWLGWKEFHPETEIWKKSNN